MAEQEPPQEQQPPPPPPGFPQQQPYQYVQVRPSNGFAVAAMVLGIVGAVFGLIPLTAPVAFICGLLGVIFGLIGISRARKVGVGMGMGVAGLVLGIVAVVLSIVGFVIVDEAVRELEGITGLVP
jgi:hypothetical protein